MKPFEVSLWWAQASGIIQCLLCSNPLQNPTMSSLLLSRESALSTRSPTTPSFRVYLARDARSGVARVASYAALGASLTEPVPPFEARFRGFYPTSKAT